MNLIRPLNTGLVLLAAAAIANARGGRRGAPAVSNVLDILPLNLREEVVDDATAALGAVADFKDPTAPSDRPPHQQRVLDEKAELDERRAKLGVFIKENPIFKQLPEDERERLVRQESCMAEYSGILRDRIAAFLP